MTEHDASNNDTQALDAGPRGARLAAMAAAELARLASRPIAPGLHLVATPIGNLGDITLRALAVLAEADVIYCEDTRHSRTLAQHFGLGAPLKPYHEHNGEAMRPRVLADLEAGKRVALISDAGTPLISDPGYKLVRAAIEAGYRVESLPGPSALLTALTLSGLPSDAFLFAGFLPPKPAARRARLAELKPVPATLIFYEAPQRLKETLGDLAAVLGERSAAIARELTKMHEEVMRGTLGSLAAAAAEAETRGEMVLVVGPPIAAEASDDEIREALHAALAGMSLRDAAKAVADALGVAKSRVYDIGLKMKAGRD